VDNEIDYVERAKNGDIEAFSELIRKYSNAVCSVAYGVTGDFHLAQDIAQDTFIKAFFHLASLRQPDKFGSWLYAIANRLSIDLKRKANREKRALGKVVSSDRNRVEEAIERKEMQTDIWNALNKLDEINRTIVVLFHLSGLSVEEIGHVLNLSAGAVESRLRRVRKRMKQDLVEFMSVPFPNNEKIIAHVAEEIIKRAGHFYIPVSNKKRSSDWFVEHFGLQRFQDVNVILPSGQILYFLETRQKPIHRNTPIMTFIVDDSSAICKKMDEKGIRTFRPDDQSDSPKLFYFYDPDHNVFGICEPEKKMGLG